MAPRGGCIVLVTRLRGVVEGILTVKQAGYEDLITRFGPRVVTRGIVARKLPARYHSWPLSSAFTVARNEKRTKIREKKRFSSLYTVSNGRDRKAGGGEEGGWQSRG